MTQTADPRALFGRATTLFQQGRLAEAVTAFDAVLAVKPDHANSHLNKGIALMHLRRPGEAAESLRQAVGLNPSQALAHRNLGGALEALGRTEEAEAAYRRALDLGGVETPPKERAGLAYALARLAHGRGDRAAAVVALEEAVAAAPEFLEAAQNLAALYLEANRLDDAKPLFERVLAKLPDLPGALSGLARVTLECGDAAEAVAVLDRLLAKVPDDMRAQVDRLTALNYLDTGDDGADDPPFAAQRDWAARFAVPRAPAAPVHVSPRDPDRPLTVAYVGDMGRLQARFFTHAVIAAHDPAEVVRPLVFSGGLEGMGRLPDLGPAVPVIDVNRLDDAEIAARLRAEGVDVAVNVTGHTLPQGLLALARRPAPVQVAWGDVFSGTGVAAIDAFVTDLLHTPEDRRQTYAEATLFRSPPGCFCYTPPADAPAPAEAPPVRNAGGFTFGSLNRLPKAVPSAIAAWAAILTRAPEARMILQGTGFDSALARERVHGLFAGHGVEAERLILVGGLPHREMLALYNQVDLCLDTFPWSGGLTTCEALWMGVPVLTLAVRDRFSARHSLAHLTRTGLAEAFVCDSLDAYIARAAAFAVGEADLPERGAVREALRASPLTDAPAHARALESLYRDLWRRWCAGDGA